MSNPEIALLMLGMFIFIILLGFPIAFTLMAMGVAFGYYAYYTPGQDFFDNRVYYLLSQNTFSIMNNDVLTAVPLFLFMGYMIERSNILDRLFPADKLEEETLKYAEGLASGAAGAIGSIKLAVHRGTNVSLKEGLEIERELVEPLFESEEAKEGIGAFMEKRKPEFVKQT